MHEAHAPSDAGGQGGRGQRPPPLGGHLPDGDERPGRAVHRLTHFSTFSGIGGLDLGLERAGWETLAFSEVDPYASAVLAERWPDVPNLGDITDLARRASDEQGRGERGDAAYPRDATLWSGGFPCQDLSIAGKRKGLAGERSGLAFAFLDLVRAALADGRGPEFILLENVPGLLSSHGGRDMAALLGALVELGYGVSFRTLDARYSGVPQRRRRVFVLGVRVRDDDPDGHLAAERAAEVLALASGVCRHTATRRAEGQGSAPTPRTGLDIAGGLTRRYGKGVNTTLDDGAIVIGEASDPGRDGEADGTPRRLDDRQEVAFYLAPESGQGSDLTAHEVEVAPAITPTEYERATDRGVRVVGSLTGGGLDAHQSGRIYDEEGQAPSLRVQDRWGGPEPPAVFVKKSRPRGPDGLDERWDSDDVAPTLNDFDNSDVRAVTLIAATLNSGGNDGGFRTEPGEHLVMGTLREHVRPGSNTDLSVVASTSDIEDALLPDGLDSHRYRCCGNAVVVNVAEWLGRRIRLAAEGAI